MSEQDELLLKEMAGIKLSFDIGGCTIGEHYANIILVKVKQHYVKWDREKVANHFALCKGRLSTEEQQHRFADQFKEILNGG